MTTVESPALAEVLAHAAAAWQLFRDGRSLDRAIDGALTDRADLRPAVQDTVYTAVRHLAASKRIIERLATRQPGPEVAALLAVTLAQLLSGRYAEYVIVDQAVTAARNSVHTSAASGFVNALLRNFLRQREALLAELRRDSTIRYNLPRWWVDRLRRAYPADWQQVAGSQQQPPPLVLRVNAARLSTDAYLAGLQQHGIDATRVGLHSVWIHQPRPVSGIPGFSEGDVSVQDAGAQLAAQWLDAAPGMRVLDACAAPGGKTAHLLELGAADVTALEIDPVRAQRIDDNLRRAGLFAQVVVGDATRPEAWLSLHNGGETRRFDRILLDAPCTASGIVGRHPDIPWLRRDSDVAQLTTVQREMLDALWPLLDAGGRLLYVVCSLFPEEGREQIARFLERHPEACQLPLPSAQLLPTGAHGTAWHGSELPTLHDGFFYALLEKTG